jgi:dTDP-4-dehydrorhamnose 3,5-epimerase
VIFTETKLPGAYVIELEKRGDARGFFARAFCQHEFAANGLMTVVAQTNLSFSQSAGTLRGMHYQSAPYAEAKLVRCTRGSLYDVIIDLRPASATYRSWLGVELNTDNRRMLYVPEGFAHGFITLEDAVEVTYQVSQFYTPEAERGVRWDDPAFGIEWPLTPTVISDKDKGWPDYTG